MLVNFFLTQVLQAFSSILQFSIAIRPYIIRFISLIKPIPQVTPSLKVSSRLLIKNRKRIGKRGNPYSIPVTTIIGGLQYLLKTNNISFQPINLYITYIIYFRKPFTLRMYRRRLQSMLLQAPLISRLSINTIKSLCIAYAVLIVVASSVSANSIKRFLSLFDFIVVRRAPQLSLLYSPLLPFLGSY